MEKDQSIPIIELEREKVRNYLVMLNRYSANIIDELMREWVLKPHTFKIKKENGSELILETMINFIRLRPDGVNTFVSNSSLVLLNKYKHWNCTWIQIKDSDIKMID